MIGSYHIQINSISLTFCGRGKKTWEQLQEEGEGERAANVQVSSSIHFFLITFFMIIHPRWWWCWEKEAKPQPRKASLCLRTVCLGNRFNWDMGLDLMILNFYSSSQKKSWRRTREHGWNSSPLKSTRGKRRRNCRSIYIYIYIIQEHFHIFICSVVLVTTHKKWT